MLIGQYSAIYIRRTVCGFVNGYEYRINIGKNLYGYIISGIKNLTEDTSSIGCINYASEISVRNNWIINQDLTTLGD